MLVACFSSIFLFSFSALRRLKTWLRSTMTQRRLNRVMIYHVHSRSPDKNLTAETLHKPLSTMTTVNEFSAIFNTISLPNGNLILSPLHFRSDRRPCHQGNVLSIKKVNSTLCMTRRTIMLQETRIQY